MPDSKDVPPIIFQSLDRTADIEVTERNLPHWFQVGTALFVTFRLVDSLPKQVIVRMVEEFREWLRCRSLPLNLAESILGRDGVDIEPLLSQLKPSDRKELRRMVNRLFQRSLDDCHGSCLLREPAVANIVAEAIRQFDGEKYDLDCFVIMPNHVHSLVQFRQENGLWIIGQSWMRYTARKINQYMGRAGAVWQREPFDHAVRTADQFEYFQKYIAENPSKPKLKQGEFLYWNRA